MKNIVIRIILAFFIMCDVLLIYLGENITLFTLRQDEFIYEYGTDISTDPEDYVIASRKIQQAIVLNLNNVQPKVGTYDASVTYLDTTYNFKITVEDTKKPSVTLKQVTYNLHAGETLTATSTVESVRDGDTDNVYFVYEEGSEKLVESKTYSEEGTYIERVVALDDNGNRSQPKRIKVIVTNNQVPPVINGLDDITIALDSSFDNLSGVVATDDIDGTITSKIVVEGEVDTSKEGTYTLTYSVTDSSGNTTRKVRKITVE